MEWSVRGRKVSRRQGRISGEGAEEEMASGATAGLGSREVRRVAMQVEYHVAGNIADGGIGVGVGIVEEPDSGIIGAFGGIGLVGGNGSEGDQHGWIDGDGIVEEHANNLLDKVGC